MEYKVRYKLTMVGVLDDGIHAKSENEVCVIGHFDGEEELRQWAERSNGELAKENEG